MSNKNNRDNEGPFERATRKPRHPDQESSEGVKFEDWDWKKHDPEFYAQWQKMPESSDKATTRNVSFNRYMMAKNSGLPKYDFSPKNFAWVMRRELAVVGLSIAFGLFILPKWQRGASQSAARE